MLSMKYFNQDKDDLITTVFTELKILGVKVPKIKKFKTSIAKQEKSVQETGGKIFGVSLSEQEWSSDGESLLPKFVAISTAYLLKFSNVEVGLFRKAGNVARQKKLRLRLESGGGLEESEPNDVASLLKQWLRELPEPLIPTCLQDLFIRCLNLDVAENRITSCLLTCLLLLPDHLHTLKHLLCFLNDVAADSERNRMGAYNLALIMAPNIFVMHEPADKTRSNLLQQHTTIVKILIENSDKIGDIPPGVTFQHSCFYSELDSSSDMLDSNTNKSKKKRRSGGAVQDIFSGFRKLVGQNGTPAAPTKNWTPENFLKSPSYPRQAISLDALDNPSLAVTPKRKGPFLNEKNAGGHVRRKSIGALLRRKERKRDKSNKLPQVDMQLQSQPVNDIIQHNGKGDVISTREPVEKSDPSCQENKSISHSGSIKKSISDCYLPVMKTEFSMLPVMSVSSSQGCLPSRPLRTSQYSLRSESFRKSQLGEASLLDEPEEERGTKRKNSLDGNSVVRELSGKTNIKSKMLKEKYLSLEGLAHIDTAPPCDCNISCSKNGMCHDSFGMLPASRRSSPRTSDGATVKCSKVTSQSETWKKKFTTSPTNAKMGNILPGETVSYKLGLTRQEGFISKSVKNKHKSSTSPLSGFDGNAAKCSSKTAFQHETCPKGNGAGSNAQKSVCEVICDNKNIASERKNLKRKTRHGSLIRGRPNSVRSGLRPELPQRFPNDSALFLKPSPDSSLCETQIQKLNETNVRSPRPQSLDLSLSILLQNFCLSSPINSPEISLDLDIPSDKRDSSFKLHVSEKDAGYKPDPVSYTTPKTSEDATLEPSNRKRLSNNSDSKVPRLKKLSVGSNRSDFLSGSCSGRKRSATKANKAGARFSDSFCGELQSTVTCKDNQTPGVGVCDQNFDGNFKTPNNKPCSPDSVAWMSGSTFLSNLTSPQEEESFNKRQSIAMILKNNTGHVQAKVSLYDNQLRNTSGSSSANRQCLKDDRILRSSSQKCPSSHKRSKVSTSKSYDSETRGSSVKKSKYQRSPLPPPPKFTLTDLSTPSPKPALKEVTNISLGLNDSKLAVSPRKILKLETNVKPVNSPQELSKGTPYSGPRSKKLKRNSFSGYTPNKQSKKVSRSESSPACRRRDCKRLITPTCV